jgi:hypothetical protein
MHATICRFVYLVTFAALVALAAPAHAGGWRTLAVQDHVALNGVEQYEEAPQGSVAYVYFRLFNRGTVRAACEVHVTVTCGPSGQQVPIVLNVAPEDMGGDDTPPSAVPYFAQAVCAPGERVASMAATLQLEALPGQPPADSGELSGRTPPPPPGYGMPPLDRSIRHTHPGDANSVGWLAQLEYGLSSYWLPTRSTVINSDGTTGFAETRLAGGLGPRLALAYWPYMSRRLAVGVGGLIEGGAMGVSNGYTDSTHGRLELAVEAGDRMRWSGIAKAAYGYRYAEQHIGNPFDLGHADSNISASLVRATAIVRLCTASQNTLPFCRMGFDLGATYEMPGYARAAAGGLLLQGSFWLRRTLAVQIEGGWSYPVGGQSIYRAADDGRSATFGIAFVFNDDFFGVYPHGHL